MDNIQEFIKSLEKELSIAKDKRYEAEMMNRLKEAAKIYQGDDKVITSEELVEDIKIRPEELKIMSGIGGLDSILKGFRPNQLIVIAAPTKNGKTVFCMDLTSKMKEYAPLWFPFEEGADELVIKFIERDEEVPHFCVPQKNLPANLLWLEQKIIEGIVKYNSKIVFIDHLHFIVPFSGERQDLMIGQTMRDLKGMAKRWGITIILIAHLKKTKIDRSPDLEDLRDSSFIAQEADTVILLWRQTTREGGDVVTTNNVNVSVQANRRTGKTGNVKMVYKEGHFYEEAWVDEKLENSTWGKLDE
jgi:replicative DNA helicase